MEIKGQNLRVTQTLHDGFNEKTTECDFIVPDYHQDVLKIVFVEATPRVKNKQINGEKLMIDGIVEFRVLYYPENDGFVKSINFVCDFEDVFAIKGLDENTLVKIKVITESVSARLLNPRKISLKSVLCIMVKAICSNETDILNLQEENEIEIKSQSQNVYNFITKQEKLLSITEELSLNAAMPNVLSILKSNITFEQSDLKLISNKAIVRGNCFIDTLHISNSETIENAQFEVPFTQIIDIENCDENCECNIKFDVNEFSLIVKQDLDGENNILKADIVATSQLSVFKNEEINFITDAYSVKYDLKISKKPLNFESKTEFLQFTENKKMSVDLQESFSKIIYTEINSQINAINLKDKIMDADCEAAITVIGFDLSNNFLTVKKNIPFKINTTLKEIKDNMRFEAEIQNSNMSFTLLSENQMDIRFDATLNTNVFSNNKILAIASIEADTSKEKQKRNLPPITLYFAKKDEEIWDIAKMYNTSVNLINSANNSQQSVLNEDKMLLIPRKN